MAAAGGVAAGGVQYAFGRHLSPEGARAADLRFTFEREPQGGDGCTTPYWQQGNASFDKTLPAKQRAALASDRRVVRELGRFWRVYKKDPSGRVTREEYLNAHARFARVLIPTLADEEVRAAGLEDWEEDAEGCELMTKQQLKHCLFECAARLRGTRHAISTPTPYVTREPPPPPQAR